MENRNEGIFIYTDSLPDTDLINIPDFIRLSSSTFEILLLRMLSGHIDVKCQSRKICKSRNNYFVLPRQITVRLTYQHVCSSIEKIFGAEGNPFNLVENGEQLKKYLNLNRKNTYIYKQVLFELSLYLVCESYSPIASFVHLYRCLEYLSYCFPLVYAAKSKDYKGTFNDLKKFFSGDTNGELKFFEKFLYTLFEDEESMLDYVFEIDMSSEQMIGQLEIEIKRIYKGFVNELSDGVLKVKFKDMLHLFVTTRNRYFHMLVGQGQENFTSLDYDIDVLFSYINPCILNWLSIIIQKISVFGFYSSLPGL